MGNSTTGIERIYTSNAVAPTIDSVYLNQWNPAKYLNVWSVSDTYLIPYQFEFMPLLPVEADSIPERDGVVILSKKLGSIGIAKSMTSRTLTHYIGHYLNLVHLWGNKIFIDGTCGDDGVNDTPITKGFNYICPLYDSASVSSCTPGVVENVQNFMEYSYCSRMFAHGQVQRMKDCLQSSVANRNQLALFKVTSIKNTANDVALWVAPNPFKDKVHASGLQEGIYSAEVFNVVGQKL
ncbi:MAG: hypothetical protein KF706_03080 [Chitinophagales bacterium]|nr:hypothetical protein [Chitinophagales bacterium]